MAKLTSEQVRNIVEDFKEAGQEYRYRDRLMVTHFSLSMTASGILLNALSLSYFGPAEKLAIRLFGLGFLILVTYHLALLNYDRLQAYRQKCSLAEIPNPKLHIARLSKWWRPQFLSPSYLMILFSGAVTVVWGWWTIRFIFACS